MSSAATQFDAFIDWFVKPFLANKATQSRDKAAGHVRATLPVLGKAGGDGLLSLTTLNAINAQLGKLPYRADPLLFDYYTHPGVVQQCLNTGGWKISGNNEEWSCDCDDFAAYAYDLFKLTGARADSFQIWNLIINPTTQLWNAWANHVILVSRYWDGTKEWTCVLDTNSAADKKPIWFAMRLEQAEAAVLQYFSTRYSVQYYRALNISYPF